MGGGLVDITHLTIEVRDRDLNRVGQIPLEDLTLTIEDQFNNVGSWTLVLPSESDLAGILREPGAGIIVTLENGDVLMSGPTVTPEDAATSTDPDGTLTVNGLTDTVLLADRLCFPNPGNLNPAGQTQTHDVRTGTCEDVMYAYVNANIGPGAPVSADPELGSRRDTRLQLGTNGHRGPVVTKRARFDVLGDVLADLAATAGIGFRIVQVGNKLEFQTFEVTNRSQSIRLDIRNNMLAGHKVATAPPSITRAIVAGQDIEREESESDDAWAFERQFVAVSTPESRAGEALWGRRIEVFVDKRQEDGSDELIQAGQEALQDGGFSQISVQVVPMEDFFSDFGVEWHLGDHITVVVQGVEMQADVTGYVLKYDSNGFRMGVILGDPSAIDRTPATVVQTLDSRVSSLERNSVTPAAVQAAAAVDSGPAILLPADFTNSTPPNAYPPGESMLYLDNLDGASGGWGPHAGRTVWGWIRTYIWGGSDITQEWRKVGAGEPEMWLRGGNLGDGFGPWHQVPTRPELFGITGEIRMWSAPTAPTGWALCDGGTLSRTTNASLFALIGTTYGAGDGSTTFNVPNLSGRVPVGRNASDSSFDALGKTGGAKQHALTEAEMPSHTHVQNAHSHGIQGNGALTDGAVGTLYQLPNGSFYGFRAAGTNAATATNQNTGGGQAHNNLQPYLVVHHIIKL